MRFSDVKAVKRNDSRVQNSDELGTNLKFI